MQPTPMRRWSPADRAVCVATDDPGALPLGSVFVVAAGRGDFLYFRHDPQPWPAAACERVLTDAERREPRGR